MFHILLKELRAKNGLTQGHRWGIFLRVGNMLAENCRVKIPATHIIMQLPT